jgi:diguanylate cyclase
MKGRGINSIQVRFTIFMAVISAGLAGSMLLLDGKYHLHDLPALHVMGVLTIATAVPAAVMYMMSGKLTGLIWALRRSTEAIAAGDFNAPVDVDCACDVGGLADSFRTMVARLNSNILRMNILAYSDPVTGLPNRAVLTHVIATTLDAARGHSFSGAVMFIDLDRFKQVNDTLGHDAGDELLRKASQRILHEGLERTLETIDHCMTPFGELCDRAPTDTLFVRFAGDEFVALLPGVTSMDQITVIASRIINALEKPFEIGGTDVTIGASIGIARTPLDTRDAAELLNFADLAMYSAKMRGRGGFAFFDGAMREAALQRVNMEREMRDALSRDEFLIHLQPKVDAHHLEVAGYEALVRWQHPVRGLVMPGEFIGIAEQSGLIEDLGQAVLSLSMRQAAQWRREGRPSRISVNVSPMQFTRSCFADEIISCLNTTGAVASDIEIELTESTAMLNYQHTLATLQRLRQAGFHIAVDDFGCGFSNLSQLSQLPLDSLKIDKSLISRLGCDPKAENVVKAIIGLGHSLSQVVVAEGVETLKQFQFLQNEKCDVLQGYLFARPMPVEDVPGWLASRSAGSIDDRVGMIAQRWRNG